jgi:hypothetical protein
MASEFFPQNVATLAHFFQENPLYPVALELFLSP